MNFNIEKGVKLKSARGVKSTKYDTLPLEKMVSGDSIFIPNDYATRDMIAAYLSKRKHNFPNQNLTIRKEELGTRIFKL